MASLTLVIKRQRKQFDGQRRWVPIGTVVVNLSDHTGSVYLNHQDEIWRLFPRQTTAPHEEEE